VSLGQVHFRVLRFVLVSAHRRLVRVFAFMLLLSEGEADGDRKHSNRAALFREIENIERKVLNFI
jgi:hypothetical protein